MALLVLAAACNNASSGATEAAGAAGTSEAAELVQQKPNEHCRFLFPAGLAQEMNGAQLRHEIGVQTEMACDQRYINEKNDAELWTNLEKMEDSAQLKRAITALSYMPGYVGLIDAGDGGSFFHENTGRVTMLRAVFRAGPYKCVIQSTLPKAASPADGVLFDEEAVKLLAMDWGRQLKAL